MGIDANQFIMFLKFDVINFTKKNYKICDGGLDFAIGDIMFQRNVA